MSHIDNALKKAQEEKDSLHNRYSRITPATVSRKDTDRRAVWTIIAGGVMICLAVIVLLLSGNSIPDEGEAVATRKDIRTGENPSLQTESTLAKSTGANSLPSNDKGEKTFSTVAANADPVKKETDTISGVDDLYRKALDYQKKGAFDEAINGYKNILNADPEHIFTLNNLGVIYMRRGKNTIAEVLFKKAIDLKNDYVDPYYNLACLYSKEGNSIRSVDYLKKAARINNDVKNWIKDDRDLDNVRKLDDFRNVFEGYGR